jgi:hypothetical protein
MAAELPPERIRRTHRRIRNHMETAAFRIHHGKCNSENTELEPFIEEQLDELLEDIDQYCLRTETALSDEHWDALIRLLTDDAIARRPECSFVVDLHLNVYDNWCGLTHEHLRELVEILARDYWKAPDIKSCMSVLEVIVKCAEPHLGWKLIEGLSIEAPEDWRTALVPYGMFELWRKWRLDGLEEQVRCRLNQMKDFQDESVRDEAELYLWRMSRQ